MPQNQQTRAVRVTVVDSRHTSKELKGHEGTQMESSQWGAVVAQWLERLTRNQKVLAGLESPRSAGRNFFTRVSTLISVFVSPLCYRSRP